MAKKLKKKIEELCGLTGLQYEERREQAERILASTDWKQELCNELQGLSFRELEKGLKSIIAERQKPEDDDDKLRIYREGRTKQSSSAQKQHSTKTNKPAYNGRTLEEIIRQAYAPRVTGHSFSEEEQVQVRSLRGFTRGEVLPDSLCDDSDPEE